MYEVTYHIQDIHKIVPKLWAHFKAPCILVFSGELGAGKTTLIKALCQSVNATPNVTSPTFSLVNTYRFSQGNNTRIIYHMDWYRIENTESLWTLDLPYFFTTGTYIFIEWGEKFLEALPNNLPIILITLCRKSTTDRLLIVKLFQ